MNFFYEKACIFFNKSLFGYEKKANVNSKNNIFRTILFYNKDQKNFDKTYEKRRSQTNKQEK